MLIFYLQIIVYLRELILIFPAVSSNIICKCFLFQIKNKAGPDSCGFHLLFNANIMYSFIFLGVIIIHEYLFGR